jgi:IS30 family transposase
VLCDGSSPRACAPVAHSAFQERAAVHAPRASSPTRCSSASDPPKPTTVLYLVIGRATSYSASRASAIGTLVERTTRFTMLLHLPRMEEHGGPRAKNGPPLAGHGAEAVRDAIASTITTLPEQLRRSLTWDQGVELAQHVQLRIDTGLHVYFCDPHSPWQRGTNENTNGLLRQYFPKGTDLSRYSADDLAAVAATLNGRPRKTLAWRTPADNLDDLLRSSQINSRGVVTTG